MKAAVSRSSDCWRRPNRRVDCRVSIVSTARVLQRRSDREEAAVWKLPFCSVQRPGGLWLAPTTGATWNLGARVLIQPCSPQATRVKGSLPSAHKEAPGDVHLRSASEVRGYRVQGSDGAIGHIDDFIVDDESWEVRYLVIDTKNWWLGKKVLVAPHWASRVSWPERKVYVELAREAD